MMGGDLDFVPEVLIRWNGIAGWCSAEGHRPWRVRISGFDYNRCSEIASLGFISTNPQRGEEQVKKLLTMVFALALTASLSFAQDSSSSGQSGTSGSTASSGQTTSGDQSTTTTKTKKHHKKHKKNTSTTDSGSTDSGSTAGTSNPK